MIKKPIPKRRKVELNKITKASFYDDDIEIVQDDSMVLLHKEEILKLAKLIEQERLYH